MKRLHIGERLSYGLIVAWKATFLIDMRKYTTQEATILTSVFFLGFTISSFVDSALGDLFAGRITLMHLYLAVLAVMSVFRMAVDWSSPTVAYGIRLLVGLFGSIRFPGCMLPMVPIVVLSQYRGTAFVLLPE